VAAGDGKGRADIRILVAYEDNYQLYRETIVSVLRILRPEAEVKSTNLEAFEEGLGRFDPEVVICGGHKEEESASRLAWIVLPVDPTLPTRIRVEGLHVERTNPTVEQLLEIIEEVG
jgi:hypothetical protein